MSAAPLPPYADPAIAQHQSLVEGLTRRLTAEHGCCERIETHLSTLLLAGDKVLKLKKPLSLGFVDFTTLASRLAACREEVRLNRRTAPQLYLGVLRLHGDSNLPALQSLDQKMLDPSNPPPADTLDYAVLMRRFPADALLDRQLCNGRFDAGLIDGLAAHVAAFHAAAAVARPDEGFGNAEAILAPIKQNFAQLAAAQLDPSTRARLAALEAWSEREGERLRPWFAARLAAGRVREGHGDLHLGNLVLLDGQARLFDALEFDPQLRWIDVAADIAFLLMDLQRQRRLDLAQRFLDGWLSRSGDYDCLPGLRFYMVYRALVRAKIAALRLSQLPASQQTALTSECAEYLALAEQIRKPARLWLAITFGVSGSGKSSQSQGLLEAQAAVRLRADVERKRLYGLAAEDSSARIEGGIYHAEANRRTYARLAELARLAIGAGWPTLVDACFLQRSERQRFRELAAELRVPWIVLAFEAPEALLRARIRQRIEAGQDASEADERVLQMQLAKQEPLDDTESIAMLQIDTSDGADWTQLLPRFLALLDVRRWG